MKKGKHVISGLILIASVLFSSLAQADFELKDSTLPVQILEAENNQKSSSLYLNDEHYLSREIGKKRYFIDVGVGLKKYGIPDGDYAASWELISNDRCVALKLFSLQEYHELEAEPMGNTQNDPFPPTGCVGFDSQCISKDGKLQLTNVYEGTKKTRQRRGGWYGSEGPMDVTFYTGQQIFTITHVPSGEKFSAVEKLSDSASYSEMKRNVKYLPELGIVIIFGIRDSSGRLQSYCIKLPEENTSQSH